MNSKNTNSRPIVEVTKSFNAPSEKLFDAWLNPDMLSQWMFGPDVREEEIVRLQTDAEENGTFSFVVRRDGEELNHRGTYRTVERPNRLVFTWGVDEEAGDESVVTIDIVSTDGGCRLTLRHEMDPKWAEYADRTREGWSFMLEKLNLLFKERLILQIVRKFDVAPEVVFNAFTKPEAMRVWWTDDTTFDIDLRVGGRWTIVREEGDITYTMTGEYLEVDQPHRLKHTIAMAQFSPNSDVITIDITLDGKGGCEVTFVQSGPDIAEELKALSPGEVSESEKGWLEGFDLMAAAWEEE